ncbi:multiple inositol polyphosphate phosphatase 1-like [Periplaneta americana]|uniref:multiple inositol polyphosphate phosphatase 1-like n=1 Tax=Periplaneta americana TaxID=6978 RepID=UPI0037E79ABD
MVYLWFFVVILIPLVTEAQDQHCYANQTDPYVMFSTYTPYELVHETSTNPVFVPQCQPLQFWIMSRHGTRYTDTSGINNMWSLTSVRDNILSNHEAKRGTLCTADLENLRKWTPQAVFTLSDDLAFQGFQDLQNMAQRFKSRFPTLLNQSYSSDKFEVRFTNTQRTTLSAFSFVTGIFGSTYNVQLPQPISKDSLIRPSSYCTKWINEVKNNPNSTVEMYAFEDGPEIQDLIKTVTDRLGFETPISMSDATHMYAACRFEKAWNVAKVSPWCAVFTDEDLTKLEYKEDLKYYYTKGFGNDMNKDVGCPPAKDFLLRFSALESGEQQPAGVFYFSHDTDLMLLFSSLGIGEDDVPITHSNYEESRNRQWRTSLLTPFAGNFAVVFFKCDGDEPYKVQFYLREKLLDMEGCDQGLCDWSYIKQKYSSIAENCNLDFC